MQKDNNDCVLRIKGMTFQHIGSSKSLLEIPDFNIRRGEKVGIKGANGSGKSTLINLLLGIYSPTSGCVEVFGSDVRWRNHYPLLGYIGDPSHKSGMSGLPKGLTTHELINVFKTANRNNLIEENLLLDLERNLSIGCLFDKKVDVLSDGERRRVMAFLALGKNINLLLADEATQGLDEESEDFLLDTVMKATRKRDLSLLWISHSLSEICMLTDTTYKMKNKNLEEVRLNEFFSDVKIKDSSGHLLNHSNISSRALLSFLSKEAFYKESASSFVVKGQRSE